MSNSSITSPLKNQWRLRSVTSLTLAEEENAARLAALAKLGGQATTMLTYNVSTPLIVPASGIVWVGAALDNDNGAGSITAAQFNSLGGLTFDPPTFGIAP